MSRRSIALIHPRVGLGGDSRLMLDAALALAARGHRIVLFTAQDSAPEWMAEVEGVGIGVRLRGNWIPHHVGQRLRAPLSLLQCASAGLRSELSSGGFDLVFCDTVPQAIPLWQAWSRRPVVYYCHYPDLLLTPPRSGAYRLYRGPLDAAERYALRRAARVLVNSAFTARRLEEVEPGLAPEVVHPSVDVTRFAHLPPLDPAAPQRLLVFGRFARSKNLELALDTLIELSRRLEAERFRALRLVFAGGFDEDSREAHELIAALEARADRAGVRDQVEFHRSPCGAEQIALLREASCLLFTPLEEHFGIVPLEAMCAARAVFAVARAGPRESVLDGRTGRLCEPTPQAFAQALLEAWIDPEILPRWGRAGRAHVLANFSRARFGERLEACFEAIGR